MSFKVEYIYTVIDRFSAPLNKLKASVARASKATDRLGRSKAFSKLAKSITRASGQLKKFSRLSMDAGKKVTLWLTTSIVALGTAALMAFSKIEQMQVAFTSMLGSATKATGLMNSLREFSTKTPFKLQGIADTTRMMLAFGIRGNEVVDLLHKIGDVAAGSAQPLKEVGLIYGQVLAKGRLQSEEMLQFAERGIPIQKELEKITGLNGEAFLKTVSKGKVSYKMFAKAFANMSASGGLFHKQMIEQSKTLAGRWSTFIDVLTDAGAEIGKTMNIAFSLGDGLKYVTGKIQKAVKWFQQWSKLNPELAKMVVYIGAFIAVLGPIIIGLSALGMGIAAIGFGAPIAIAAIASLTTGILSFTAALLVNPIFLVATAIAAAAYLIYNNWEPIILYLTNIWEKVKTAWTGVKTWVNTFVNDTISYFDPLMATIGKVKDLLRVVFKPFESDVIQNVKQVIPKPTHVTPSQQAKQVSDRLNSGSTVTAQNQASQRQQPLEMRGKIEVAASGTTEVVSSTFDVDSGSNMLWGQ